MQEFSTKTGIRGFSFAYSAKNKVEKFMWSVIIIVSLGLTCWDVHDTVKNFTSFPTGTKVSVIDNSTISLGKPTFCIPFANPFDNLGEWQDANSTEIEEFFKLAYSVAQTANWSDKIAQLNQSTVRFASLSLTMLDNINRAIYYTLHGYPSYNYKWGYHTFVGVESFVNGTEQVVAAANWLRGAKISFLKLTKIVGKLVCKLVKFQMWATAARILPPFGCDQIETTWIGEQSTNPTASFICYRLPQNYFEFSLAVDVTLISYEMPLSFRAESDADYAGIDFSEQITILPRVPNIFRFATGTQVIGQVSISAKFKMISHSYKPCSSVTAGTCVTECRNSFIAKWCRCQTIPILYEKDSQLPECTPDLLDDSANSKCLQIRSDHSPDPNCTLGCYKQCEFYSIIYTYVPGPNSISANLTQVNILVDPFSYTLFEEMFSITTKQFLGFLGGNLSLYLGASFIVLFHAVVFWTSVLLEKMAETLSFYKCA